MQDFGYKNRQDLIAKYSSISQEDTSISHDFVSENTNGYEKSIFDFFRKGKQNKKIDKNQGEDQILQCLKHKREEFQEWLENFINILNSKETYHDFNNFLQKVEEEILHLVKVFGLNIETSLEVEYLNILDIKEKIKILIKNTHARFSEELTSAEIGALTRRLLKCTLKNCDIHLIKIANTKIGLTPA